MRAVLNVTAGQVLYILAMLILSAAKTNRHRIGAWLGAMAGWLPARPERASGD